VEKWAGSRWNHRQLKNLPAAVGFVTQVYIQALTTGNRLRPHNGCYSQQRMITTPRLQILSSLLGPREGPG
jgi:hypothetical protein